jgi:hypothetical protein
MAVRAILAMAAPPSDQVECVWQHVAVERLSDDPAGGGPDAGQVGELAGGVQPGHLAGAGGLDDVAGPGEGPHLLALGQVAVEQVDDAVEGVGGVHHVRSRGRRGPSRPF